MALQRTLIKLLCLVLFTSTLSFTSVTFAEDLAEGERIEKINDIELKIEEINTRKKNLQKQLNDKSLSEEEKTDLTQRIQTLTNQTKEFNLLFEQTVLGGIDLTLFQEPKEEETPTNANYNWQQEVLQILQPFFAQMQRMTEKARTRDQLIEDRRELIKKIDTANIGLTTLQGIDKTKLSEFAVKQITKLDDEWIDKLKSLEHQKNIVDLKLEDLTDNRSFFTKFTDNLWSFIKNEGLAIVAAVVFASLFYYIFSRFILLLTRYIQQDKKRVTNFKWRFVLLIFQAVNVAFTLAIFMVILHTSGNIMLFGIVGLILLMLAISFRAKIPAYLNRLRVFLNLGQAREGERIIYNDIPWEISKINLSTVYLTNPLLDNGELRVTIDLIDKLYSRDTKTDELWFPSRKGDILLLPDKRIVKVVRQTPESIYLSHDGATIVMGTAEFYKLKFSNLSRGYSLTLNFTIEDTAENRVLFETVETNITEGIKDEMHAADESLLASIKSISLSTRQLISANATSYQVIVEMTSNSATKYLVAKSALNRAVINEARSKNWAILLTENI